MALAAPHQTRRMAPGAKAVSQLRAWLAEGRFPGDTRLPPEQSLADELGVSRGTIRTALNTIEEEGAIRSAKGRGRFVVKGAVPSRSVMARTIGLLADMPNDDHHLRRSGWMQAVDVSAGEAIAAAGLHMLRMQPRAFDSDGIQRLLSDPPKGVVVAHLVSELPWGLQIIRRLRDAEVKIVVNGDAPELADCDRVVPDQCAGARALVNWLASRGRSRILRVWTASPEDYWLRARDTGYLEAVQETGVDGLPKMVVKGYMTSVEDGQDIFEIQTALLAGHLLAYMREHGEIDAIMATTDPDAYPLAAACRLLGKEPNVDIDIVGYDNVGTGPNVPEGETTGPIATIDKQNHLMGQAMVSLLLDRIAGRLPARPQRILVLPRLNTDPNGRVING